MSDYPNDRRETPRLPVSARVVFKEGDREEVWFTEDLSLGGLSLKAERPPFMGTLLELEISLPGAPTLVKARGEVVWRYEGKGCGVRFVRITAQNKKIIEEYLKNLQESL